MPRLIAIHPIADCNGQAQTIGRGEGHDICVLDPKVTRDGHARIVRNRAGAYELHDLGSRNGTLLNGVRVAEPQELRQGDMIRCGDSVFVFEDLDGAEAEALGADTVTEGAATSAATWHRAYRRLVDEYRIIREQLDELRSEVGAGPPLVGSLAGGEFLESLRLAARSEACVLVQGETGTGKELVARELHRLSPRGEKRFVTVNCAALADTTLESELFGHRKGAFTGADQDRLGRFRAADGGTLFLDEVSELSASAQAKLLRALECGEVQPLGSDDVERVDVRVVAATNRPLPAAVEAGRFRADLYHRLNILVLSLPPLRERPDDVAPLAREFLRQIRAQRPTRPTSISPDALKLLRAYPWPGNVRELRNAVERAAIMTADETIAEGAFAFLLRRAGVTDPDGGSLPTLREGEKQAVERALLVAKGNKAHAARLLGIDRTTLYDKIKAHGLRP